MVKYFMRDETKKSPESPRGNPWTALRIVGWALLAAPPAVLGAGYAIGRSGAGPMVPDYDEGAARAVQYVLFGLGVVIFLFADSISNFMAPRLLGRARKASAAAAPDPDVMAGYMAYTVVMMGFIEAIAIFGLVGFLICGNFTWLTVFVALSLGLQWRYLPSPARLERLLAEPRGR